MLSSLIFVWTWILVWLVGRFIGSCLAVVAFPMIMVYLESKKVCDSDVSEKIEAEINFNFGKLSYEILMAFTVLAVLEHLAK